MIEMLEVRTCDMAHDKSRTGETIQFGFDGADYEVELCPKDKRAFDLIIAEYAPYARKVRTESPKPSKAIKPKRGYRSDKHRDHSAEIRDWARGQGMTVSDKGRIPVKMIAEYDAAH
jgi:Lsr2